MICCFYILNQRHEGVAKSADRKVSTKFGPLPALRYLCNCEDKQKNYKMRAVKPKKNLGQHFLTDLPTAQAIADTIDACPDLPVLEVGPGMGMLTQFLLPKGRETKVVEIDRESVAYLLNRWPALADNILGEDFLRMDLSKVFGGRPFVLTGNYPYDISSQIFFKMLDFKDYIPCCTGMIQKEAAERIAAPPGTKAYGILSVLLQRWYSVEYLFTVESHVFNPPPKVRSAVVRMTRNDVTDCGCNEQLLRRVVKTSFNQRRKMLRGSLKPLFAQLNNEQNKALDHTDFLLPLTMRPEQLSVEQFVDLTNRVEAEMQREG